MKPLVKKTCLTFLLIIFTSYLALSQTEKINTSVADSILYSEELIVLTDRDIYIAGEKVYLKIFKLNRLLHTPENISKVVYIDLLDSFNNTVKQVKAGVNQLSGSTELTLPDTIATGNYLIRSCTKWMQNFSGDFYSYKRISVINPFQNLQRIKIPDINEQPDSVAFYAESGNIVSGLDNIIGCRAFYKNGYPSIVRGFIVNSKNDTLCSVTTDSYGTGLFSITPCSTEPVFLVTGENAINKKRFPLPKIHESGVVLSLRPADDTEIIKIKVLKNGDYAGGEESYYILYSSIAAKPIKRGVFLSGNNDFFLKKDSLPAGLARITITNREGIPLAQRWIFNDRVPGISYDVKLNDSVFSTRSKVRMEFFAAEQGSNTVSSNFSVSVVKSFAIDKSNSGNFPVFMQLPSLAAMNVSNNQSGINDHLIYYCNDDDPSASVDRGVPEDFTRLPELGGLLVSGVIINKTTGEPLKNEFVVFSIVGKSAICRFARTDENGHFNFVTTEYGSCEIVIQPLSPDRNGYYAELDNPFPVPFSRYKTIPFYPDTSKLSEINKAIISMQVKEIYDPFIKGKSQSEMRQTASDFYGESVETFVISNYIELSSLREIVKEIIPGLTIYKRDGKNIFRLENGSLSPAFEKDPFVLVDGTPVNDIDKVLGMNPAELERIEILHKRYFISDIVIEGIIHFITKKGNLSSLEFNGALFRQEFDALQPISGFKSPDYSVDSIKNNRIPDFRNTLYWNGDIETDENGRATVEFYTSDEPGEYTVLLNGISADGKAGKTVKTFKVLSGVKVSSSGSE